MKSKDELLASYVRNQYPEIEKSLSFKNYYLCMSVKEAMDSFCEGLEKIFNRIESNKYEDNEND